MNVLRILILCIAAALVCTSLRMVQPQIASAVALAVGVAVLMLSADDLQGLSNAVTGLEAYITREGGARLELIKVCSIAMIAEFASDICRDAGELALARRIDTGVKIGIVAAALPAAMEMLERILQLMP